jgi:hypothetical protein
MIRSFRAFDPQKPQSRPQAKTDGTISARLHQIAYRLERLSPDVHNPEAYFERKSELVRALKQLGHRVRDA